MRFVLISLVIFIQKRVNCHDSDSTEINHVDLSPYYDTIVYSDVLDIINELNKNSQFNGFTNSDSESEENVEDLLSEYQHYLEKAHEQKRIYLEKTNKTKNKVPVLRHDTFFKTGPRTFDSYNNDYYSTNNYNSGILKFPPAAFGSPLDLFIPISPPFSYNLNKPERETVVPSKLFNDGLLNFNQALRDKKPLNEKLAINEPIKTPCICPSSIIPCICKCKDCVMPLNSLKPGFQPPNTEINRSNLPQNVFVDPIIQEHLLDDMSNIANTLNVKIKVDIQIPKILKSKQFNRDSALEYEDNSKELTSNIRLPTTSFNFPIPIDMFGYKRSPKNNRHDFRKITIHRKKKSRSNTNKKHRKKLITFHNIKVPPTQTLKSLVKEHHTINIRNKTVENANATLLMNTLGNITLKTDVVESTTFNPYIMNSTQFEEGIFFMVNISNNNENEPEGAPKTGNSIELDFKTKPNISSAINMRQKRELTTTYLNNITKLLSVTHNDQNQKVDEKSSKHLEKVWFSDAELLYWPSSTGTNDLVTKPKSITDIILEREHKKAKLNLTKETIQHNHTKALEQAIFGQVDWNDMDTIAPTFISFVGKYINGIITFCSSNICHSMKCADKMCIHRTCLPDNRFNNLGHCYGSNKTDSIASMESIMDLPSNIAFEIVDILQDKMLGKLHGKVTLCIGLKCITFAASKKKNLKIKCISKNLNKTGHCLSIQKT